MTAESPPSCALEKALERNQTALEKSVTKRPHVLALNQDLAVIRESHRLSVLAALPHEKKLWGRTLHNE
jgi:hypothetical protein